MAQSTATQTDGRDIVAKGEMGYLRLLRVLIWMDGKTLVDV